MDNLKPLEKFFYRNLKLSSINTVQTGLFAVLVAIIYENYGFSSIGPIICISSLVVLWLIILSYITRKKSKDLINVDKQYRG